MFVCESKPGTSEKKHVHCARAQQHIGSDVISSAHNFVFLSTVLRCVRVFVCVCVVCVCVFVCVLYVNLVTNSTARCELNLYMQLRIMSVVI